MTKSRKRKWKKDVSEFLWTRGDLTQFVKDEFKWCYITLCSREWVHRGTPFALPSLPTTKTAILNWRLMIKKPKRVWPISPMHHRIVFLFHIAPGWEKRTIGDIGRMLEMDHSNTDRSYKRWFVRVGLPYQKGVKIRPDVVEYFRKKEDDEI